jgi:hypothetical protein
MKILIGDDLNAIGIWTPIEEDFILMMGVLLSSSIKNEFNTIGTFLLYMVGRWGHFHIYNFPFTVLLRCFFGNIKGDLHRVKSAQTSGLKTVQARLVIK